MIFVIRLFSEISIKSGPVRKRWTKHLCQNLRGLLRQLNARVKVRQEWDRIEVKLPVEDQQLVSATISLLQNTPGIATFSHAQAFDFDGLEDIYRHAHDAWAQALDGLSFCVRVKRSGKHAFSSVDVERYVGAGLNRDTAAKGVKLKQPDITLRIDIQDEKCLIVQNKYKGLGGYPVGTQSPVLSLVSGGFDSTVASFMMIKRGLRTHYCFFNLGGKQHELDVKEIAYYLWNRFGASHKVRFFSVPFDEVVTQIQQTSPPAQAGVILKRMMLRAADRLALRFNIQALVTGEAVAQVSSQTLDNLTVIDAVTDRLVLRPLIVLDKPDIIDIARQIGAESFSASVVEYCGAISSRSSAKVTAKSIVSHEQGFDFSVLDRAISAVKVQAIDQVMQNIAAPLPVRSVAELNGRDVLIDIRHPEECEVIPFTSAHPNHAKDKIEGVEILQIPFYSLNTKFDKLDASREYLLYCKRGVLSQLHAAYLHDEGHKNVAVYRPD